MPGIYFTITIFVGIALYVLLSLKHAQDIRRLSEIPETFLEDSKRKKMNETEQKTFISQSNLIKGILIGSLVSIPVWFIIITTIFIF